MYIENIDIYMRKIYKIANKIAEVSTIGREMQNDAHSKWQIKGYVYEEKTNKPIEGFTVKAFIVSKLKENEYIGNARTDFQGRFIIQYRKTDFVVNFLESLSEGGPDIILSIYNHEGKLVETTPKRSGASRFEEYEILLPITSITTIPSIKIDDVLAAANIIDKVTVGKLFNETGVIDSIGLLSLAGNLKPDKVGLDEPSLQRVFRVAKFHLASGSISLAGKLTGLSQVRTLCELGSVPRVRIEKMLGKLGDEELIALDRLSATALSIRNNVVNYSAARQREKSRDGQWYPGVQKTDEGAKGKEPPPCKDCDPWENVFSPRAYLFDLLDLIYFHWDVTTSTLEKVLFQEIDKLGSEEANETLPQVEIAVEVLENYLKATDFALPIGDYELANACVAEWIYLLDVTEEQLQKAVDAADANVVELAKVILATKFDLSVLQSIRELLTWSPDSGPDPGIASFSAAYGKADAAFLTALASTYARVLVLYRDALIENSHEQQVLPLQEKLFVDLQAQPCGETNRITQLIISLQAFILAVRTGDIADVSRKDLSDDLIDFKELSKIPVEDAYWRWLKDFETWASAMYTLLYPENVLMPPLFDEGYSDAFKEAQQTLSGKVDMKAAYGVFCNYLFSWSMPVPLQDLLEREEQSEGENDEDDAGTSLLEKKIIKRRAKFAARMKRNLNHRTLDKLVEQAVQTIWDGMWWIDQFPELSEYCSDYLQHVDSHGSYTSAKCFPWEDPSQKRLQELNLHFPLLVAWALNHSGEYAAANDWYRRLYDPMRPKGQRFIFPFGEHFSGNVVRGERWFDDMVDPQQIAERREGVYLRYSILAMVKNLLSWADHEYALGRPESIDRARRLYELAQRVLSAPDLADHCGQTIRELELDIVTDIRPEIQAVFPDLKIEVNRLRGIMDPGLLSAAIKDFRELISDLQEPRDIDPIRETVSKALRADRELRPTTALGVQLDQAHLMLTQCEDQLIFTNVTLPSSRKAEVSTALSLLGTQMIPDRPGFIIPGGPIGSSVTFCVPANPLLKQLNFYTEQSLLKLRSCLSIDAEPLPSASLPTTASDVIDTLAGEAAHRPNQNGLDLTWNLPRYRYAYLIEKARQYVDVAQRLGSMLLMAYEKREEECLRQLTATQTLELAKATVTLKDLAVDDAETANLVAVAQQNRAEYQRNFWQNRIQEGMLSAGEITGLGMMATSGAFQLLAAATNIISAGPAALVAAAGAATTAAGIAAEAPTMGASSVAVMTGSLVTSAALAAGGSALAAALGNTGGALSTFGQVTLNLASFERRWEEWNLSLGTSNLDLGISKLQVTQAKNRIAIADQDKKIGELQQAHAEQTLNFLKNKFSNDKLYIWMIDVLEQCYKSLMQIATAVARQAQSALEFERQKTVEIITGDYWSIEAAGAPTTGMTEEQRQSGLLGAERLLTDLTKLDAFKLATDRRQLQLSKTISMAQTIPRELVELRPKAPRPSIPYWTGSILISRGTTCD